MIRVSAPVVTSVDGPSAGWRVTVRYSPTPGDPGEELWFEGAGGLDDVDPTGTPWAVALAPLAFHTGRGLRLDAPVDDRVAKGIASVTEIWSRWYGGRGAVDVDAPPLARATDAPIGSGTDERRAAFFSGGVDSLWTALAHRDRAGALRDLVTVHGFDIPLSEGPAFERMIDRFTPWAASWGARVVPIRTNYREAATGRVPWGEVAHGSALIAAGLVLAPRYDRLLIAATGGERDPHPWGSHVETDAHLGSSRTRVEHHGADATRWQKVRRIAEDEDALSILRVCWRSGTDLNCGRCSKCLRTMALLDLWGALERAPTFPDYVSLEELTRVHVAESWDVREFSDLEQQGMAQGRPDLARAARRAMLRTQRRERALSAAAFFSRTPGLRTVSRLLQARVRAGWIA
ncbi:MAG: hypothetical protein AAF389_07570 [Gemmatimonadota bacterium]